MQIFFARFFLSQMFYDDQIRHRFDSPDLNAMEIQPLNDELPKTTKREWRRIFKLFVVLSLTIGALIFCFFFINSSDKITDARFLEFSDIKADLVSRTFADQWSTNIPAYILGLSRGGKGGVIGLGMSDASGSMTSFTASECEKIEWTDHDGVSFGSEELVAKHGATFVVDWIREKGDIFVRIKETKLAEKIPQKSFLFLTIEGMEIKENIDENFFQLFDPFDFTDWTLSVSEESFRATVERFNSDSPPNVWVSPSNLVPFLRTSSQELFEPKKFAQIPQNIYSINFLFFSPSEKELVFRIGSFGSVDSLGAPLRFPEETFSQLQIKWRSKYANEYSRKSISQLMGNLGRFSGPLSISNPVQTVTVIQPFISLTAIGPSRTKFPRGFLWDEGFHLLAILRENQDLATEIVTAWLRTQSVSAERGWIPREHALSFRDRASIPPEFLAQDPRIANPPTLVFILTELVKSSDVSDESVTKIAGHVVRWLAHLERTQLSTFGGGGKCFRWSLRTSEHCLSSGLDDYPRGTVVNEDECHLDLHSWMMLMVRFLKRVCEHREIDQLCSDELQNWAQKYMQMHANLLEIFSIPKTRVFGDWIGNQPPAVPIDETGRRQSSKPTKPIHSPHIGYINMFPLFLGLLSPTRDLEYIRGTVDLLETHLVSPYGLLSLSRSDPLFGSGENYWKGNIWGNMNLLAVGSLGSYASKVPDQLLSQRMKNLSNQLKSGWLMHAKSAWKVSGGPREYLKPTDGSGGGVYPFAGWTAASIFLLEENIDFWDSVIGIDD